MYCIINRVVLINMLIYIALREINSCISYLPHINIQYTCNYTFGLFRLVLTLTQTIKSEELGGGEIVREVGGVLLFLGM